MKTWVRAGDTGAGCCAIAAALSPTANAATGISFDVRRTTPVIRSVFISVLARLLRINTGYIHLVASTEQKGGFRAIGHLSAGNYGRWIDDPSTLTMVGNASNSLFRWSTSHLSK